MAKLILTADWHFSTKNPVSRTDNYNEALFAKLDQIRKVVVHVRADAVCIAGDLFHAKDRAPWAVVNRMLEWAHVIREANARVLVIPGNHDEKHDRFDSLTETPYGVLVRSGLFEEVSQVETTVAGIKVIGVPWPWGIDPAYLKGLTADVVLVHGFTTYEGGEKYGVVCHRHDDLAVWSPHVRLWHFGHDHADHGVFTLKTGAKLVTIGALSRGALDSDSILRQPKIAIAEVPPEGPVTVTQVNLKVAPSNEVFDLTLRAKKQAEAKAVQAFVEQLKVELSGAAVDYRPALDRLSLPQAVKKAVEDYISRAESAV